MKNFKIFASALLGMAMFACSSPEKMAEQAENVIVTTDPVVLEVVAGKIDADVTVTYPADYFNPKAILEVTPVIVYEGGEEKMEPMYFQGSKVEDNYEVVPEDGATITKHVSFTYKEGMEKCHLELRGVARQGKKSADLPSKKAADGAITTYMLVCQKGSIDLKADNYQEIIKQTAEGQIMYTINSSYVNSRQLKSESVKNFQEALKEINSNERKALVSTDVVAYASPDGAEDLNTKLSANRSKTAEQAFGKVTKGTPVDAPVNVQSIGEDWEGFQALVAESDLEDKDIIIRVLSMYSDPAVREKEIKNMSAVYKTLAKDVLPELRRARFIANVEFTNYTSEELLKLVEENSDVLDEEALLRAATLVAEAKDKLALYDKAVEKYGSDRARFNIGVIKFREGDIAGAEAAFAKVETKDGDLKNAEGVIALNKGDKAKAADLFKAAGTRNAKENLAVLDILDGKYADAAAKLADAKGFNKALALVLTGKLDEAKDALCCKCPKSSYLKAVIAARQGNKDEYNAAIAAAKECKELAARAEKDVEFATMK